MIEIKIPSDIHSYKTKLVFGFSTRQLISIIATVATAAPIAVYGKNFLSEEVVDWVAMLVAAPIVAWGFFTYKDMKFEDFIAAWVNYNLGQNKRVYEDTDRNIFYHLNEEINELNIVEQRLQNGEWDTRMTWRDEI